MTDTYLQRCIDDVERTLLAHALGNVPPPVKIDLETLLRAATHPEVEDDPDAWDAGFAHAIVSVTQLIRRLADRYDVGSVHYGHFAELLEALDRLSFHPE